MWAFVFTEEMRNLGLTGNDLLVYAVINGYSQGDQGCYYGSREYLCEVTGAAPRTIDDVLKRLIDKSLVRKFYLDVAGRKSLAFATQNLRADSAKSAYKGAESAPQQTQNLRAEYKVENKNIYGRDKNAHTREKSAPFSAPTVAEVREYCQLRRNQIDPEEFVAHYESNGWMVGKAPMKNWKAAVVSWEKNRVKDVPGRPRRESAFERAIKSGDAMFGTNWHEQLYGSGNSFDNAQTPEEQ